MPGHAPILAAIEAAAASPPWSEDALRRTLSTPSCRGWLAWRGDRAVGHLLGSSAGGIGEIWTVAVLREVRRQGIGEALMRRCAAAWREEGVSEAFLEVREGNVAARALYSRLGWVEVGRRSGYYADGEDAQVLRWEASC